MGDVSPTQKEPARRRFALYAILAAALLQGYVLLAQRSDAQEIRPLADAVSGDVFSYEVKRGDSLHLIGSRFGVSERFIALRNNVANPDRLKVGTSLIIDNRHLVPERLQDGILINIPQRMLFLFSAGELVSAYPVGLGRPDWPTPVATLKIAHMEQDKEWCVPESIQKEMLLEGQPLLERVPPGPDNPLGKYWIGLSKYGIGIHATIAPASVFRFRSHGCIRLHEDDAADLYARVRVGMPVKIIYAPALLGRTSDGRIYAEVHPDVYARAESPVAALQAAASFHSLGDGIDWSALEEVAARQFGVAQDVTRAVD